MSPDAPDDDDRTVIRPTAPSSPTGVDPGTGDSGFAATQAQMQTRAEPRDNPRTQAAAPPVPPTAPAAAPASEQHGDALPIGMRLGEFEITRVIGAGGFGIVYLATDHSLQRQVALKEYMPSALASRTGGTSVSVKSERHRETFELGLRSFINEARLLAQFDHPSLVKVFRFWEAHGTAYMAMPFYEGITLKDRLRLMGGPPDEAWLMGLLAPLTEALQVIHAQQCFHRDIAPDNIILLAGSGRPRLLDFGAARRVIGDMTQALTVILKPGYAPLEQYAEVPGMKQGPWTDVYALAAVVYYAILGKTPPPSVGRMMNDTCARLAEAAAGRYSERFLRAIDHALGVRPEDRTPSIDAFRQELGLAAGEPAVTGLLHTGMPSAGPVTELPTRIAAPATQAAARATAGTATAPSVPAKGNGQSSKAAWIGGAAGLAALLGAGAFWALGPHGATPSGPDATQPPAAETTTTGPTTGKTAITGITTSPGAEAEAASAAPPADEFERIAQGQSPGFEVRAEALRSPLRIDKDRLRFTVRSTRDGYVYVIAHDPDGSTTLLFPNTQARDNRIRAGQSLSLPQASWPVVPTEPAGQERFLVIVSPTPRELSGVGQPEGWFRRLGEGDASRLVSADAGYGAARFTVEIVR